MFEKTFHQTLPSAVTDDRSNMQLLTYTSPFKPFIFSLLAIKVPSKVSGFFWEESSTAPRGQFPKARGHLCEGWRHFAFIWQLSVSRNTGREGARERGREGRGRGRRRGIENVSRVHQDASGTSCDWTDYLRCLPNAIQSEGYYSFLLDAVIQPILIW